MTWTRSTGFKARSQGKSLYQKCLDQKLNWLTGSKCQTKGLPNLGGELWTTIRQCSISRGIPWRWNTCFTSIYDRDGEQSPCGLQTDVNGVASHDIILQENLHKSRKIKVYWILKSHDWFLEQIIDQ